VGGIDSRWQEARSFRLYFPNRPARLLISTKGTDMNVASRHLRIAPSARFGTACAALLAALGAGPIAGTAHALEAQVYAITSWDYSCSGSTRNSWDNYADNWYDDITNTDPTPSGHDSRAFSRDRRTVNGSIADSWFVDSGTYAWGNDTTYLDEGDAAIVCLHGGESSGRWYGKVRINEAGTGNCKAWQGHMELGDRDLEFLHLSSCNSMDDNQWSDDWHESFDGLHLVTGFHGYMYISAFYVHDYEHFSDDAFNVSIADSWIDNLYRRNANLIDDQCPVSYGVGPSESSLWTRMDYEQYDNVYSDPSVSWWGCVYISGCDPQNEGTL